MGIERGPEYYNAFMRSDKYRCHYSKSWYFPMWKLVINHIKSDAGILEIGCGSGQFAEMLFDSGFNRENYYGFDFSEDGIAWCKRLGEQFSVGNALDAREYSVAYDTVICLEVLEHINEDLRLLGNIKRGALVIASVPESWDPAHVRVFTTEESIVERYGKIISIESIESYGYRFIFKGKKL